MARSASIALGGATFTVHPLNIGELEEIADFIEAMASGTARQRLGAARGVLAVALRRDAPTMGDSDVKAIEATPFELMAAVRAILALSGYSGGDAASPGEAPAGAPAPNADSTSS